MLKAFAKALMARTPYRLVRSAINRFDAIEHCLRHLAGHGYRPEIVIDGGAHAGDFARMAKRIFPTAAIHMIDPQPACGVRLSEVARAYGFHYHPVALGAAEGKLPMWAGDTPSTGASMAPSANAAPGTVPVSVTTLDRIFPDGLDPQSRALFKLDLQGYELEALKGAAATLKGCEVVLTEVSFFAQDYEPSPVTLINHLDERGFDLFDIAALSSRASDGRLKQGDFIFVRRDSPLSANTQWD